MKYNTSNDCKLAVNICSIGTTKNFHTQCTLQYLVLSGESFQRSSSRKVHWKHVRTQKANIRTAGQRLLTVVMRYTMMQFDINFWLISGIIFPMKNCLYMCLSSLLVLPVNYYKKSCNLDILQKKFFLCFLMNSFS